ncbi:2-oxoglutarate dehydrogenase, mitochondrial-like protein [Tanacetum coccineum]
MLSQLKSDLKGLSRRSDKGQRLWMPTVYHKCPMVAQDARDLHMSQWRGIGGGLQRVERDAAIAWLEQSIIVLALRLADHHGKNYKVTEEARAFVGSLDSPILATAIEAGSLVAHLENCHENAVNRLVNLTESTMASGGDDGCIKGYESFKPIELQACFQPESFGSSGPVVVGKTQAKQYYSNDVDRTKNLSILIHDDGSFAGQVVVYETLHLSALPNYTTGGTIHIVMNKQVSLTTDPKSGRSLQYCTDVAKALNALIFHVNGDDVETVVHACDLAAEWRQTYVSLGCCG